MKIKPCYNALLATAAATLIMATPAQATLQARDLDGDAVTDAFYDTTLNITWLRDANVNGQMDWNSAVAWAAGYSIGSYSDWRLPTMVDTDTPGGNYSEAGGTDSGFNVQTTSSSMVYSEMASLFYDTLGNKSYCTPGVSYCAVPQLGWGLTNTGDFLNLQTNQHYWSGLEYAPDTDWAWSFNFNHGFQGINSKEYPLFYALAVRPGDVPEPGTLALAALALAGLGVIRRRALGTSGL